MEHLLKLFLIKVILFFSKVHGLSPELVFSVCYQESLKGAPTLWDGVFATRYEPGFYSRYIENKKLSDYVPYMISEKTERKMRATSWGVMQTMGQTAREMGFCADSLASLILPWRNIDIGCKFLAKCIKQEGSEYNGLRRYNGRLENPDTAIYADSVTKIKKEKLYFEIFGEI